MSKLFTFVKLFMHKNVYVLDATNMFILYVSVFMQMCKNIQVIEPNFLYKCMFIHEITVDIEADVKATFVSKGFCIDIN